MTLNDDGRMDRVPSLYTGLWSLTTTEATTLTTSSLNCVVSCYLKTPLKLNFLEWGPVVLFIREFLVYLVIGEQVFRESTPTMFYTAGTHLLYVLANDAAACMMRANNKVRGELPRGPRATPEKLETHRILTKQK